MTKPEIKKQMSLIFFFRTVHHRNKDLKQNSLKFYEGSDACKISLWNFEGGGEISPTLLSKLEGGEEISPQGEFPPRVPSWPRKSGAYQAASFDLTINKSDPCYMTN